MTVSAISTPVSADPSQAAIDLVSAHLADINTNLDDKISSDEITQALPLLSADEQQLLTDFLASQRFQDMDTADGIAGGSFLTSLLGSYFGGIINEAPPSDTSSSAQAGATPLDVNVLENRDTSVDADGVVTTTYRENTGADGDDPSAFGEDLAPSDCFPATDMVLHYQFKPEAGFDWARGGKLPGLQIGEGKAAGGVHTPGAASARLMWQGDGSIIGYVYPMPDTESPGLSQGEKYGNGLFKGDGLQLNAGDWNDITVHVKLNTIDANGNPNSDGLLEITVNGKTMTMTDIQWRLEDEQQITAALVTTFFGGPDNSPKTQTAQFQDIEVTKIG